MSSSSSQWITDLIKHLEVSKTFACALCCASLVLLFGPYFFPSQIPLLKDEFKGIAIAALSFSGIYIITWIVKGLWQAVKNVVKTYRHHFYVKSLSELDNALINIIAIQSHQSLNLSTVGTLRINSVEYSQVELIQYGKGLARRGFVTIGVQDSILMLSEAGKAHAARLHASLRETLQSGQ